MGICDYTGGVSLPFLFDCTQSLGKKAESLQTQIYIVSGALGGVVGVLLILTIVLLVSVFSLKKEIRKTGSTEMLHKRGYSAYTGKPDIQGPPLSPTRTPVQSYQMAPPPPPPAPARLNPPSAAAGYDNHAYSRDRTAGGVRVLPGQPAPVKGSNYDLGPTSYY